MSPTLIRLDDALEALGRDGSVGRRTDDVPLEQIVGTVNGNRARDFDQDFRLVNSCLQDRWGPLAHAMRSGIEPPPIELVQLGELYFVSDGHHRVSVARAMARTEITARIHQICTVAYAMCCLRLAHLGTKRAERRFLERVPLPDAVRGDLWLDEPTEWMRLADAAEAWGMRRSLERGAPSDRRALADSWWSEEVVPVLERLRADGVGLDLRDVQLYVTALAVRDRLGDSDWPDDLADRLQSGKAMSSTR